MFRTFFFLCFLQAVNSLNVLITRYDHRTRRAEACTKLSEEGKEEAQKRATKAQHQAHAARVEAEGLKTELKKKQDDRDRSTQVRRHLAESCSAHPVMMLNTQAASTLACVERLAAGGCTVPNETMFSLRAVASHWANRVEAIKICPSVNDGYVLTPTTEDMAQNPEPILSFEQLPPIDEFGTNFGVDLGAIYAPMQLVFPEGTAGGDREAVAGNPSVVTDADMSEVTTEGQIGLEANANDGGELPPPAMTTQPDRTA